MPFPPRLPPSRHLHKNACGYLGLSLIIGARQPARARTVRCPPRAPPRPHPDALPRRPHASYHVSASPTRRPINSITCVGIRRAGGGCAPSGTPCHSIRGSGRWPIASKKWARLGGGMRGGAARGPRRPRGRGRGAASGAATLCDLFRRSSVNQAPFTDEKSTPPGGRVAGNQGGARGLHES